MGPELQGILSINNCGEDLASYLDIWVIDYGRYHKMAKAVCQFITVLSVDFIWENVCAILH